MAAHGTVHARLDASSRGTSFYDATARRDVDSRRSKSIGCAEPGDEAVQPEVVNKTGMLLKQRDILNGWRERYFALEGKMLSYYRQRTDTLPRGAVFLSSVR